MKRTIIVADLHGCYAEALELLEKCQATPDDQVIFIGDLVDRGPDSHYCVDLAIEIEQVQRKPAAILGNHDEQHLQYHALDEKGIEPNIKRSTHAITRQQLKEFHYQYLRSLPLFLRLPEYNAAVVHAGVFPGRSLEEQDPYHLLHIQMINPGNNNWTTLWPNKIPNDGWKFWTHFWDGPERIIFGHSVLDKPLITDKVVGIDGGACFGGNLNALILPSWELVSVKGKKNYGNGFRGAETSEVQKYLIHGDVSTFS